MSGFLSVDAVFFTAFGYPLSYLEFFGTIFCLWSVWLVARRNLWTWPIGIVSVVAYLLLFYQIQLYSDCLEQAYYLVASVYGWWYWTRVQPNAGEAATAGIGFSSRRAIIAWLLATAALSVLLGRFAADIHRLLPRLFPDPAAYPYLDAVTTMMSFTAQLLLARKRVESWCYWIIVDVIAVGLYWSKDIKFVALLYLLLLGLATNGLVDWLRSTRVAEREALSPAA